jgi:hypothetical protein
MGLKIKETSLTENAKYPFVKVGRLRELELR